MVDVKKLKEGDILFEYAYGAYVQIRITKASEEIILKGIEPKYDMTQWRYEYEVVGQEGVSNVGLVTKGMEHYGPKLSWNPDEYNRFKGDVRDASFADKELKVLKKALQKRNRKNEDEKSPK